MNRKIQIVTHCFKIISWARKTVIGFCRNRKAITHSALLLIGGHKFKNSRISNGTISA